MSGLTESEELELLELEEEEARAKSVPVSKEPGDLAAAQPAPAGPKTDVGTSAIRGLAQGTSLGFADELSAGLGSAMTKLPVVGKYMDTPLEELLEGKTNPERSYAEVLSSNRAADKKSRADNPKAHLGAELFGAVLTPGPGKSKAATGLGRFAQTAGKNAGLAGLFGLGASEADLTNGEFGGAAGDALVSALIGGAASGVPWLAGEMGQRVLAAAKRGSATAQRLLKEMADKMTAKGVDVARGTKGGTATAGRNVLDGWREIVARASEFPEEVVALAKQKLASDEAKALELNWAENVVDAGPDKLAAYEKSKQLLAEALEQRTPEALAKLEAELGANPLTKHVWPRVRKQLIDRGLVPAVGSIAGATAGGLFGDGTTERLGLGALGGLGGGLTGALAGAMIGGRPSSAFEKMVANPAVKKMLWEWLQKATNGAGRVGSQTEKLLPVGAAKAGASASGR